MPEVKPYSEELLAIAKDLYEEGPGAAQENVVLQEAGRKLGVRNVLDAEQRLLEAWQWLFQQNKLAWGYNLNNPGHPFFHIPH